MNTSTVEEIFFDAFFIILIGVIIFLAMVTGGSFQDKQSGIGIVVCAFMLISVVLLGLIVWEEVKNAEKYQNLYEQNTESVEKFETDTDPEVMIISTKSSVYTVKVQK